MTSSATARGLGWFGIVRLGAVQAAIGAMVMVVTSLLNRVMVVEYALAAAIPAALVGWHYAVQLSRPVWGYRADRSRARTPWILTGMGILALGVLMAVDAALFMAAGAWWPVALAILGYTMIGIGVGMAGTSLLALLASRTAPARKPAAAAICWTMMVAGIVVAAATTGAFLDPFSPARLAIVTGALVLAAFVLALIAIHRIEASTAPVSGPSSDAIKHDFAATLRDIWADRQARQFTAFVFISMLAYSMQDLILEPFAGFLFAMTPGESTRLAGTQHQGILLGMLIAGAGGSMLARRFGPNLKLWIVAGCFGSAIMLAGLSVGATVGLGWPLRANVFGLGVANGIFAVAAVGAMLGLASDGKGSGEGARMGVWGASQAIAFGAGGLLGAVLVDALRASIGNDGSAFQTVFAIEAALFIAAAFVAFGTRLTRATLAGRAQIA